MEINNFRDWYSENEQTYDNLTKAVVIILSKLFNSEGLTKGKDYVLIDSRLKPYRSFNVKINKKDKEGRLKYSNPTDITDLAGLRVVGYILSDIDRISTIVKGHFDIDTARSTDKSKRLGKDKIGFRGVNYVSSLREELIDGNGELEKFRGLHFEIQVTSLLDFAWSQIEHDRNYKTGVLISEDTNIPRRFLILSGLLEIADNEFESLSKEVDRYAKTFWQKIDSGEEDTQINPSSLRIYLRKFDDIPGFAQYFGVSEEVLEELKSMGINTLSQLRSIIPDDFKQKYAEVSRPEDEVTFSAILRDILIISNADDYFKKAWKGHFNTIDYHAWKVYQNFKVDTSIFPDNVECEEGSDEEYT